MADSSTAVPTISIITPELKVEDCQVPSGSVTPESPTIFEFAKQLEKQQKAGSFGTIDSEDVHHQKQNQLNVDEAIDLEYKKENSKNTCKESDGTKEQDLLTEEQSNKAWCSKEKLDSPDTADTAIRSFYHGKSILITGATGFIGKAVLWKLIQSLHDSVDKIYLLFTQQHSRQRLTARGRFYEDILSNKAFTTLRRSIGAAEFDDFVDRRVYPFYCELTESNIGLSDTDIQLISEHSGQQNMIVFHCAGSMDGAESIHQTVKTNTYGTLQLYNFLKKNQQWTILAFLHLSILQPQFKNSSENYLYPLPEFTTIENEQQPSVMELLGECMNPQSEVIQQVMQQQRKYGSNNMYKNSYLFAKSLTEHVLVDQVIRNKEVGMEQIPIAILRLSSVGPSVQEPLIGWADGVNGLNGIILLMGKGDNKVIPASSGHTVADVVPVDYVARLMICSAATIINPNTAQGAYTTPKPIPSQTSATSTNVATVLSAATNNSESRQFTMLPSEYAASKRPSATSRHKRTSSVASNRRSFQLYSNSSKNVLPPQQCTIPVIYHVSNADKRPVSWQMAYNSIRQYWMKATNVTLLPAKSYFTTSPLSIDTPSPRSSLINETAITAVAAAGVGLSRARTVMTSLRGYYSGNSHDNSIKRKSLITQQQNRTVNSNRNSHRMSRTLDKASKSTFIMKDTIYCNASGTFFDANDVISTTNKGSSPEGISNIMYLNMALRFCDFRSCLEANDTFDPNLLVPEDADHQFWVSYFLNASYGIHYFVCQEISHTRIPTPVSGWNCSIQPVIEGVDEEEADYYQQVIARQVNSIIFSQDQVTQRTNRMVQHVKFLLQHPHIATAEMRAAVQQKKKDSVWLTDLDDALDDYCQDDDILQYQENSSGMKEHSSHRTITMALGRWRRKVGSSDESVKVIVLNDKRVNQAITHITQKAGVSKQTAVNEAIKILMRMSERTQLAFVWFTGSFLRSLLDNMFDHVRISKDQLRMIRQATMGKRVVYVPVSKSILDPLLVWYLAIRYRLPVPALACDEVLVHMGPISDVYRLAGAYYIKRDRTKRSPLNSAVTAAYTQVLLREHGALSFCLERSRSRTGKYQEAYPDGFVDMIIEATLQTNQGSSSSSRVSSSNYSSGAATIGNTFSRIVSAEITSPPESPSSAVTTDSASSTLSMESTASKEHQQRQYFSQRKVHKDVVFVPLNITYENVPELSYLIDQVLESRPMSTAKVSSVDRSGTMSSRPSLVSSMSSPPSSPLSTIPQRSSTITLMRPSEAKDRRKTLLSESQGGIASDLIKKKGGHITFGVGSLISVQDVAEEVSRQMLSDEGSSVTNTYEDELVIEITRRIHESQRKALVVSPISMISAIILYGRATHGVCIGKIKDLMEWMKSEIIQYYGYTVEWQDGEDLDTIILTSFKLLDEAKNIIIEGSNGTKDYINDDNTNIRVNDHADNVMTLSYYANQMVDIFLLDAFFAVVYLSFLEDDVLLEEFKDRFRFLLQLLEKEFVLLWNLEDKFKTVIDRYLAKKFIRFTEDEDTKKGGMKRLELLVNMENDPVRYERMIFLASLVYPTVDAYWITSCSLSALEAVPMLPRSVVPLLTQWIATHLISGRRTLYREVLSTESSKIAVDVFMSMGFLHEIQSKEKLSPDAQILLHELGVPTSEILIELTGQNKNGGKTPISPQDPEGMMKAVMAQIQMNRANSNMADLCQQIDTYRLGAASQRESFQNAQVFQKCLRQIKGILQANTSFAKRRHIELPSEDEHGLVQLVYSLLASSVPASGDRAAQVRALRRISEAYNLR